MKKNQLHKEKAEVCENKFINGTYNAVDKCIDCDRLCRLHKPSPTLEPTEGVCKCCGMFIAVRNPSGYCDHLYYPENCNGKCQPPIEKENLATGGISCGSFVKGSSQPPTEEKGCVKHKGRACFHNPQRDTVERLYGETREQYEAYRKSIDTPPQQIEKEESFTVSDPDAGINFDIHPNGIPENGKWKERFDIFYKNLWDEWESNSTSLSFEVWREDQVRDFFQQSVAQARQEAFTEAIGALEEKIITCGPENSDVTRIAVKNRNIGLMVGIKAINSLSGRTK